MRNADALAELNYTLCFAINNSDFDSIMSLIEQHNFAIKTIVQEDKNCYNKLLQFTCKMIEEGKLEQTKSLLAFFKSVDEGDSLFAWAYAATENAINYLFDYVSDRNTRIEKVITLPIEITRATTSSMLQCAICSGCLHMVAYLLSMLSSTEAKAAIAKPIDETYNMLCFAAARKIEIVQLLLSKFNNAEVKEVITENVLCAAAAARKIEIVQLLLSKFNNTEVKEIITEKVLCAAAQGGALEVVQLLFSKFNNTEVKEIITEKVLRAAAAGGKLEVVQLLLSKCSDTEVKKVITEDVLCAAAQGGALEVVQLLFSKFNNTEVKEIITEKVLRVAAENRQLKVVKLFLSKFDDANVKKFVTESKMALNNYHITGIITVTLLYIIAECDEINELQNWFNTLDVTEAKKVVNAPYPMLNLTRTRKAYGINESLLQKALVHDLELIKLLLQNGAVMNFSQYDAAELVELDPVFKKTYEVYKNFIASSKENNFAKLYDILEDLKPGDIILEFSINANWDNMLNALVEAYIKVDDIQKRNKIKQCIAKLIALDPDRKLDAKNKDGKTAIDIALANNLTDLLDLLITANEKRLFTEIINDQAQALIQELNTAVNKKLLLVEKESGEDQTCIEVRVDIDYDVENKQYKKGDLKLLNAQGLYTLLQLELQMAYDAIINANINANCSLSTQYKLAAILNDPFEPYQEASKDKQETFVVNTGICRKLEQIIIALQKLNRDLIQQQREKQRANDFKQSLDEQENQILIRDNATLLSAQPYLQSSAKAQQANKLMLLQYSGVTSATSCSQEQAPKITDEAKKLKSN